MKQRLIRVGIGFVISIVVVFFLQMLLIPVVQGTISLNLYQDDSMKNDPFTLGQYYFNSDDDPAGPYDLKKARMYYEQVILEKPERNAFVWYQLGRIDFLEGDFDSALYKFNKQVEYFGNTVPNVYYMIGLTYGYKARKTENPEDWQKAADGFDTFLNYVPDSPWGRTDLSWVYFAQGKFFEMLPVLTIGLEQNPDHPWLLNMYGLALRNLGQEAEAQVYFEKAKEAAGQMSVAQWGRAYPGNSPDNWAAGLDEFQSVLGYNSGL